LTLYESLYGDLALVLALIIDGDWLYLYIQSLNFIHGDGGMTLKEKLVPPLVVELGNSLGKKEVIVSAI